MIPLSMRRNPDITLALSPGSPTGEATQAQVRSRPATINEQTVSLRNYPFRVVAYVQ